MECGMQVRMIAPTPAARIVELERKTTRPRKRARLGSSLAPRCSPARRSWARFAVARGGDFAEGFAEGGDGFGDGFAVNELAFAAAANQVRVGEDFHVMRNRGGRDAAHGDQVLAFHVAPRGDRFENLEARFVAESFGDFLDLGPVHRHANSIIRFRLAGTCRTVCPWAQRNLECGKPRLGFRHSKIRLARRAISNRGKR